MPTTREASDELDPRFDLLRITLAGIRQVKIAQIFTSPSHPGSVDRPFAHRGIAVLHQYYHPFTSTARVFQQVVPVIPQLRQPGRVYRNRG